MIWAPSISEAEGEIIRNGAIDGYSVGQVVTMLSQSGFARSHNAVAGFAHRNGLSFRGGRPDGPQAAPRPGRTEREKAKRRGDPVLAPRAKPSDVARPTDILFGKLTPKRRPNAPPPIAPAGPAPRVRRRQAWPTEAERARVECEPLPLHDEASTPRFPPGCKWPSGDAKAGTLVWCNAPRWRQSVYCGHHHAHDGLADAEHGTEHRNPGAIHRPQVPHASYGRHDHRSVGGGEAGGLVDAPQPGPVNGLWGAADWLFCRDGKWRAVEPGAQPLAHGSTARVGRLRAYGNAVTLGQAQGFVEAIMECLP